MHPSVCLSKFSSVHFILLFVTSILGISAIFLYSSVAEKVSPVYADADQYVTAEGTKLYLNGEEFQFTGVNAFNLATYPGVNAGCGHYVENLDTFFNELRPNSVVRLWAFQGTGATHTVTKKLDWAGIDRVVNAAERNGKKLILVLGNQDGHCDDGHYKDRNWYEGEYTKAFNTTGNGLTPLPYLDYVKAIVERYKNTSAIAMWEPINEPAAGDCVNGTGYDCYTNLQCIDEQASARALKSFFDTIGATIKNIDPNHLISSGALGNGQCGTIYENYQFVHSSNGIDVGSYHDYDNSDQPMPGDPWNGLQKRITQMANLNKPLYIGEVGMKAGGSTCMSLVDRRDKLKAKMDAQFAAGIVGYTPWSLTLGTGGGCNFDLVKNDPTLTLLKEYPVKMSQTFPPSTSTPFPIPTPLGPDTTAPTPPNVLTSSNITANAVTLNWSGATDNTAISRYEIYRDYQYVTAVSGTTYTNSGLLPNTKYVYYIKVRDKAGNSSGMSIKLAVTTNSVGPTPTPTPVPTPTPTPIIDTQPPTPPTSLSMTNLSPTQVTLNWSGATDNVGINRYEVYRDYQYTTAVWGTSYTNAGLIPGKSYVYYIKSRDAANLSSGMSVKLVVNTPTVQPTPTPTPQPTATPIPGPDIQAPTSPTVITPSNITSTSVNLTWSGATDNIGINRYEVYKDYSYVTAIWGNSYKVNGLLPNKKYVFYLKSRDNAGNSSGMSTKISITTLP